MNAKKSSDILSIVLYVLAAVTLIAAIYFLIGSFGFIHKASESMQALLTAFGPVAGLLVELVRNSISTISIVFVVLTFIVSALLFTAAQILVRSSELRKKVDELETRLSELEKNK